MLTSPVLIAIIGLGIVVLLALIVAYLKSRGASDRDSQTMLVHINSSLDEIMDRVDSLEAQRKAGVTAERATGVDQANHSDVDDFLSQFDRREPELGEEGIAAGSFGVSETAVDGVSNDDFWNDFDRPLRKLDGHDRETQASLKPRSDRPMRLSRQTLAPQDEEQERMQEEIRRRTVQHPYQQSQAGTPQGRPGMPQSVTAPSQQPVSRQTFVQPVFASAGTSIPAQQSAEPQVSSIQFARSHGSWMTPEKAQPDSLQPHQRRPAAQQPMPAQHRSVPQQPAQPSLQQQVQQHAQQSVQQPVQPQVQPRVPRQSAQSMMAQWGDYPPVQPQPQARPMAQPMQQIDARQTMQQPIPQAVQQVQQPAQQPVQPVQQQIHQPQAQPRAPRQSAQSMMAQWGDYPPVQPQPQVRPVAQTMPQAAVQPQARPMAQTMPQAAVQPQVRPVAQPMQQPAVQPQVRPVAQTMSQPARPVQQGQPAQPVQQTQSFVHPQFTQAPAAQTAQPVQPAATAQPARPASPVQSPEPEAPLRSARTEEPKPEPAARPGKAAEAPAGGIKYTDRSSGLDKQGRSHSVEELMQQIR